MSYDEVDLNEALDLVLTLPCGSLYVSKKRPEHSWSEAREISADIRDWIAQLAFALRGLSGAPHVMRPCDILADRRSRERARKAKAKLEGAQWQDVEGG